MVQPAVCWGKGTSFKTLSQSLNPKVPFTKWHSTESAYKLYISSHRQEVISGLLLIMQVLWRLLLCLLGNTNKERLIYMTVSSVDAVSSSDSFALLKQGLYYVSLTIMELAM